MNDTRDDLFNWMDRQLIVYLDQFGAEVATINWLNIAGKRV